MRSSVTTSASTLPERFTTKTLDLKMQQKLALQSDVGWPQEPKRMMVCLPAGMSDMLGGALLQDVLPGLFTLPVQLVILGKGSSQYGSLFTKLAEEEPHRVAIVQASEENQRRLLAASDAVLFLASPDKLSIVDTALHYGTIPIGPACDTLENYNPNQETGNAFTYDGETPWHCFAAAVRAVETYRFPFDWRTIQRHCMKDREEEEEEA